MQIQKNAYCDPYIWIYTPKGIVLCRLANFKWSCWFCTRQ